MTEEITNSTLDQKILLTFKEANGSLTPKEISERLKCSETSVRLILYSLEMKGHLVKYNEDLYSPATVGIKEQCDNRIQDISDAIVKYIQSCQAPASPHDIAKALGFRSKKQVNPMLYHLQVKGVLRKVKDIPPLWHLADTINEEDKVEPTAPVYKSRTIVSSAVTVHHQATVPQPPPPAPTQPPPPPLPLGDFGLNGLNIYTHNGALKNPISVFNEYGQRNHIDTKIEVIYSEGPSHNPKFTAAAFLGVDKIAEASEKTKKDAKRLAAEIAVAKLSGRFAPEAESQKPAEEELKEYVVHIRPVAQDFEVPREQTKQEIILMLLQEHDILTSKEISSNSSLSESAVKLVLNQLLFQGLVKKVEGRPPQWTLIKSTEELKCVEEQIREMLGNIINFLRNLKEDSSTTQEIADALKISGKKMLTPLLHRLQAKNILVKIPNTPPLWRLQPPYDTKDPDLDELVKNNAPDVIPFESRIVHIMSKHPKSFLNTAELSTELGFKNQLEIGDILNDLQKKGVVRKMYDVPPTWALPDRVEEQRQPSPTLSTKEVAKLFAIHCRTQTQVGGPFIIESTDQPSLLKEEESMPQSVMDVLNSESFAALMKNPVSAFHEYGQRNRIEAKVEIVAHQGPSHDPRFKALAMLGEEPLGEAWDKTKKDAKRQAAELAVRNLVAKGKMSRLENPIPMLDLPLEGYTNGNGMGLRKFDVVAALSHKAFNEKVLEVPEYMGGRKVLAALVMFRGDDDLDGSVICLGTGNRCITGEHLSQDGLVVNDSHAEVITRRGFMRFLYQQLKQYSPSKEHPILEPSNGHRLKVKAGITFHLYISTAPCGDGALFAHNPKPGEPIEAPETADGKHHPIYTKSLQGLLRSKMEAGEGTIPIDPSVHGVQSWDAILTGERLRTMSCSDKIARWNVIGMQGALLSLFLDPIYLSSITLGNLYHHGHLSRAVCCRLEREGSNMAELLPSPFRHIHPELGKLTVYTPPRETEKTKPHSINWCVGDEKPELISAVTGTVNSNGETGLESRLCKAAMFHSFKEVCQLLGHKNLLGRNYQVTKILSKEYQQAKVVLIDQFKKLGRGTWIRKPMEEEEFL
ncbi:hypothetical protein LAZ67_5001060 [Cordylochernes scorpioides]|uniref:Double-stranded RNA-specific adenosine deaminase n=1 Tax=Cordylochernes scorpioides TaxID=51811 RepID=A0ABY6KH45_9ARAC|nr:hypothetical protein LAZ67_5001060 [Cordylochernes scorpioides]